MENKEKNILYILTFLLDITLLFVFFINDLIFFDKLWILLVILTHIIFYYSLFYDKRNILDILHYLVFILPILALFTNNIYIKLVSLFLVVVIQFLWVKENRCILNETDNKQFGYGNELNYCVILLNVILSFNIGYIYKSNSNCENNEI
jgi:hypothetical protein